MITLRIIVVKSVGFSYQLKKLIQQANDDDDDDSNIYTVDIDNHNDNRGDD